MSQSSQTRTAGKMPFGWPCSEWESHPWASPNLVRVVRGWVSAHQGAGAGTAQLTLKKPQQLMPESDPLKTGPPGQDSRILIELPGCGRQCWSDNPEGNKCHFHSREYYQGGCRVQCSLPSLLFNLRATLERRGTSYMP